MKVTIRHGVTESQQQFINSNAFIVGFIGGVGSGKTRASCLKALSQPPNTVGALVSPTYPMLRDTMLRTFLEIAEKAIVKFNKAEMYMQLSDGKEILFRSADNPERLRGINLGWAGLDEAALVKKDTLDILIGRVRLHPGKIWLTTTPKGTNNWLYEFINRENARVFKSRTFDNPFLPQSYIEELKNSYTKDFYRQEVLAEFVDYSGGVYDPPTYYDSLPNNYKLGFAFDIAYTQKKTSDYCVILVGRYTDNKLYIEDMFRKQIKSGAFVKYMKMWQLMYPAKAHTRISGTEKGFTDWLKDAGVKVIEEQTIGDKLINAQPSAVAWNKGEILIPSDAPWTKDLVQEVTQFSGIDDPHDDIVDALITLHKMFKKPTLTTRPYV